MVGQRLIEVVAKIPAMGKIETGNLDELTFRAQPFEEHHQVTFEEDDRIDRRPTTAGVTIGDEVTDKREIEDAFKVPIEMISGDSGFQGNEDGTMKIAYLRWTEHRSPPFSIG